VDAYFWNGTVTVSLSLLHWNTAHIPFMIVWIQSPPGLVMMQEQKLLIHHCLSYSGWGRECVSLAFSYKGSRFIPKEQRSTKVNILRLAVGYVNATINRKTRNTELEIVTNGSIHTRQTRGLTDTGPGLSWQHTADQIVGRFWNPTELFLRFETRLLADFPDPLPTLDHSSVSRGEYR